MLNHFSEVGLWGGFERILRRLAGWIGFRSEFRFEDNILARDWTIRSVCTVNFLGLSRLVTIRN